jgi:hypothetical protein
MDELLSHKELLVKSLPELSEENLCKLGEVLAMILFRQDFLKVEKKEILRKVSTKSNAVFIDCLNDWKSIEETCTLTDLFSDIVRYYYHKDDMKQIGIQMLSHFIKEGQFEMLNGALSKLQMEYVRMKSDP